MRLAVIAISLACATGVHADPDATPVSTPPKPLPSLRAEGARVASEMAEAERLPGVTPIISFDGRFGLGWAPNGRAATLNAGASAATFVGEMLMYLGAPLAAVGALATGATLDAAASDAARDTEARESRVRPVR